MQLPPRGGTWVGSTCDIVKSMSKLFLKSIITLYMLFKIYNKIIRSSRELSSREPSSRDRSSLGDRGTDHRGIFTRKEGMSPCFRTRMIGKTLTRVTAGTRVGVRGREIKSCRGLRFDFEIELDTTGRVSRCLKPTVWTVERSVSGVLYISSLLRNLKLPKRKGISDRGF
ncbi:hypothetical protein V1477_019671 [Vespula maculifrons]|uniref:Uncharacterized protein n=1 Tax=Vespula maculifrons TaxID=7453 RepID=A0ABD2ATT4_VESMC